MVYLGLIFTFSMFVFGVWMTIKSLRTGVIHRPWPETAHRQNPIWYWMNVAGLSVFSLGGLAFTLLMLSEILGRL